ncbi:alpha/beta hydrolase [Nocardioides piscis]|uniref:DUF1023 domain-containing protein n=1 Tax=Nocardioides piscis TaxID=2714938 RepID=A0A6G7YK29_9ACTN|nr:alpha/beta hydrolase [Nocardioides piscis]QIK77088.1 hypothetical protein G7071_18255 [Nocardioides piscis]
MSTIIVPASEPAELLEPKGDPAGIDDFATVVFAVCSRHAEFADRAHAATAVPHYLGRTRRAYVRAAGRASAEQEALAQTARRVARTCAAHADTLRDLGRTHDDLVERKRHLDGRRAALADEIESSVEASEAQQIGWRLAAGHLKNDYARLVLDHDALQRRVRDAEELVRTCLAGGDALAEAVSETGGRSPSADEAMQMWGAPASGASPREVATWWEAITEEQREAVTAAYPDVIGSADGLPAGARDDANRILLQDDIVRLGAKQQDGSIDPREAEILANATHAYNALARADDYVDPLTDEPVGAKLWLYRPGLHDGDGKVAISVGDLDTADDVSVFTPGIDTEMADAERYTGLMANLHESARYNGDGSSVATMFWLGYDTPDGPADLATLGEGRAHDGGERLAAAIDGLRASRADDPAHLTAIGHSYGSTTTAYAFGEHGARADDVVLIGSPGAGPADHASDLGVGEDHVYVGRNSRDGVAFLGDEGWVGKGPVGLGADPSSEGFGATRFEAEDTGRGDHRDFGESHGSYLEPDSESLYNLGRIVDGHGEDINGADLSEDPWWRTGRDPEWDRDPSQDVPGRSRTNEPD